MKYPLCANVDARFVLFSGASKQRRSNNTLRRTSSPSFSLFFVAFASGGKVRSRAAGVPLVLFQEAN